MPSWFFIIEEPGSPPCRVALSAGMTLGRGQENSIVLRDRTVGNRHLEIIEWRGQLYIEDLGSKNNTRISAGPTLIEGQRYPLVANLRFKAGRAVIKVGLEDRSQTRALGETSQATSTELDQLVEESSGPAEQTPSSSNDPESRPQEVPPQPLSSMDQSSAAPQPPPDRNVSDPLLTYRSRSFPLPPTPAIAVRSEDRAHENEEPHQGPSHHPIPEPEEAQSSADFDNTISWTAPANQDVWQEEFGGVDVRLVVVTPVMRKVVRVTRSPFSIGSDPSMDLTINNRSLAPRHATVHFKDGGFIIQDRSGSGMSRINGTPLTSGQVRELSSPCSIRLGNIEMLFLADRSQERRANRRRNQSAGANLVEESSLSLDEIKVAAKIAQSEDRDLAELLLLRGRLSPYRWIRALESTHERNARGRFARRLMIAGIILGLVGGASWYLGEHPEVWGDLDFVQKFSQHLSFWR